MLVGSSLLFSVGGTLLIMLIWGVGLNRTSLAAFIIAMGMLVDNAIVVTDNAQVGIKRGLSRYQALVDGATKPQWAFFLADVFGASFGGRNCQAIVYRAWCILGVKLDIGFDANDDFREFHLEGGETG